MILFLKATVPGGARADLFATPVDVAGYTTKEGVFVAPHHGTRLKRREAAQADLFAAPAAAVAPDPEPIVPPVEAPVPPAPESAPPSPEDRSDDIVRLVAAAEAKHRAEFLGWDSMQHPVFRGSDGRTFALLNDKPLYPGNRVNADYFKVTDTTGLEAVRALRTTAVPPSPAAAPGPPDVPEEEDEETAPTSVESTLQDRLVPDADIEETRRGLEVDRPDRDHLRDALARDVHPETGKPIASEGHRQALRDRLDYLNDEVSGAEEFLAAHAATPLEWGVPAGTSKAQRRKFNAAAMALLSDKTDEEMTDEDRQVLARYSGRGGIGDSLNEFYTEPAVASAMWTLLGNVGFTGGEVLEPSSGIGVFLHTAPAGTRVTAVELDGTAARIAGILHRPAGHEVDNSSLERFATQDGRQFDAVIGNVPFGLRGSTIKDDKPDLTTADQYFVDTALDKAKDGGIVALIVPTGIMDSRNGRAFRERALTKGEFLGAHRLPNTAFEASHTGVTSDVVLFRKRPQDAAGALGTLNQDQLQAVGVWDPEFLAGTYFTEGRGVGNILGRMEEGWRAKAGMGHDITVTGDMAGVPEALAQWEPPAPGASVTVQQVLDTLGDDSAAKRRAVNAALKPSYQVAKPGDVRVINGVRYVLQGHPPRWHRAEGEVPEAVEDARAISEMLDDLANGRSRDPAFIRVQLGEALDEYIKQHGVPSRNKELLAWLAAPHMPNGGDATEGEHAQDVHDMHRRVARLLGAVSDDGSYSDLVTGRAETRASATLDTVATKLALETGGFSVHQLVTAAAQGRIAGGTDEGVLDHLFASPNYAVEADGRTWTTLDSYLAGELWPKLDAAKAAASHEGIAPEFRAKDLAQAAALEEVIQPQSLEDVEIQLNAGFITPEIINAWFGSKYAALLEKNPSAASWAPAPDVITFDGALYHVRNGKGGRVWGAADLIERYLNRDGVKKDERDRLATVQREFRDWLLTSEYRGRVEDAYNRSYRGFRARLYSDAPIVIPGLNPVLDVNAYHFAGLRWALEAGKGIIAADVGLGKTGRGLMMARLAKITGQAQKPTFVVPKSVLANWMREAEFWFPGSRVLVIGETYATDKAGNVTSKPDDEATRRRKYHELQQNDYDFVFISQPAWNDLDLDPIKKGEYANSEFWAKRGDALGNAGDKRLNQIRTAYDQALAQREFSKREDTVYFNELGIDMLLLDEGHAFKNLYAARNRFGQNPKFLGGSGLSNRAQDTYFKTRALRDANGGKGVFMLTATPTKNSPLEVYSMLSHIAPEAFERMGIKNSEDFLDRFCEFKEDSVLGVNGEIEDALVTAGFKNLNELREVMRRYIDRKTAEDVGLVIPDADNRQHMVDMTPDQESVYQVLRAQAAESGKGDATGDAHIFSIMSKMGQASIDLSLVPSDLTRGLDVSKSPKIDACVAQAVKGSEDGGQIIFCDSVDVHDKIVAGLVAAGVPRNRIGVVNAKVAPSSAARQKISDDFNSGKLSYVIGNVTMNEGMNLQKRTTDIHHLDLPWEPATVQQRNGRGRRQGNKNKNIRIHTYLAKGSFDGYRWQTVAAKKDWQDLLWNGGDRVENLAREGAFSRQDMLIMLSANPEEARAKYAADKVAAELRQAVEGRGKAVEVFVKFQDMKRSLAALKGKKVEGEAVERLERKVARARDKLREDRWFTHKDSIDSEEPVIIEPTSGHAWRRNMGMEIAASPDAPLAKENAGRYVVEAVDPEQGVVFGRRYGAIGGHPMMLKVADMQSGVTPFEYSAEAETKQIEEHAAKVKAEAGEQAAKKLLAAPKIGEIKNLAPEMRERLAPTIQTQIKQAIREYKDGHHGMYGMLTPEGEPIVVPSYDARKKVDDHDLILPTEAHRQKATDAYVDMAMRRKVVTNYQESRRRKGAYGGSKEAGIKGEYPGFEYQNVHENPWDTVLSDVFGPEVRTAARAELHRRVAENVAAAPTFRAALVASLPTVDVPSYGRGMTAKDWPVDTVKRLYVRAKSLGVLDQPIKGAAAPSSAYDRNADLHPGILETQHNYHNIGLKSGTVGAWLLSLLPDQQTVDEAKGGA